MTNDRRRCCAVYGGSFDPPHLGHVQVAMHVASDPTVDALWIVPTYQHPFGKPLTPFEHRLRMCELAFAGVARVEVLDVERSLAADGRSATLMVDTLRALSRLHPDAQLRLVIGSDLVEQLDRWSEPERIRALAPLYVVQRGGHVRDDVTGPVFPNISSTEIRQRLAQANDDLNDLLPNAVLAYIRRHGLYGGAAA